MYYIQHCFICRPSDSTVRTDAGIEPRTVATGALAVRRSNHSARSLIRSRLDLIRTRLDLIRCGILHFLSNCGPITRKRTYRILLLGALVTFNLPKHILCLSNTCVVLPLFFQVVGIRIRIIWRFWIQIWIRIGNAVTDPDPEARKLTMAKSDQDMDPELTPMRIHNAVLFPTFLPIYSMYVVYNLSYRGKVRLVFQDVFMSFSPSDFEPPEKGKESI
jgi:hypothetical protein